MPRRDGRGVWRTRSGPRPTRSRAPTRSTRASASSRPAVDAELAAILDQAGCPVLGSEAEGCPSRVSALKACLDDVGDSLERLQLGLTCAAAGQPVPESWSELVIPASCAAIRMECGAQPPA